MASSPDIIFISGRQNSGNTMLAFVFANVPNCFSNPDEDTFFDHASMIDRMRSVEKRPHAVIEQLRLHDPQEHAAVLQGLLGWHREHPHEPATDLYSKAVELRLLHRGREFGVQKATSYIFFADMIFSRLPRSRMLYMLRNPYDLCTSRKHRAPTLDRLFGIAFGWNRGIQIAHDLQTRFPERFRIVRYEDLVTRPQQAAAEVFEFLQLPFELQYLDIPHVNPAEARFDQSKIIQHKKRGLTQGRVYRYPDHLSETEIAAMDMLVSRETLARYYPDLPHQPGAKRGIVRAKATMRVGISPLHYIIDRIRLFGRQPLLLWSRTLHRISVISKRRNSAPD